MSWSRTSESRPRAATEQWSPDTLAAGATTSKHSQCKHTPNCSWSPYIKAAEAAWLCERLRPSVRIHVLTSVSTGSIGDRSLDMDALRRFAHFNADSEVTTLPRLHAKVFVADTTAAIVTSANLTTPGIEYNFEYGLGVTDRPTVAAIRDDLEAYARLGSPIDPDAFDDLSVLASEIITEHDQREQAIPSTVRAAFNRRLRAARHQLVALQVGRRSSNEMFGEAIRLVLRNGPRSTTAINAAVHELLPDFCDDSEELIINGDHYGKAWKHRVRNAQQHLKRQGVIANDVTTRQWFLIPT